MSDCHSRLHLCKGPVGPLVSSADERSPLSIRLNLRQTHFGREVSHTIPLILAEKLVAAPATPDVDSTHDIIVVDEVDDAIVNDIVLMSLQDRAVVTSDVEKSWLKKNKRNHAKHCGREEERPRCLTTPERG